MVGIAGKSRACHSCRKRRVACGFERPHCVRCQKAGIECPGYQRRALFVNRTVANPLITANDAIGTLSVSDEATRTSEQDVLDDYHTMERSFAASSYVTSEFRSTAFRILRRLYLPRESMMNDSIAIGTSFWVTAVCDCVQESSTLDLALLALCASQLYITQHGGMTLDRALEVYSSGLSRLANSLQRVNANNLPCLLGSIVALSTCELFVCPLTPGWRAHVQGMAELLRFRTEFDHHGMGATSWMHLCARARVVTVLTDMMSQTQTNVTAAQWRTIMPDRPEDDPMDNLLDIISDIPALFKSSDSLQDPTTSMLRILKLIYDWEQRFRKRIGPAPYSFVPSQLSNPADEGHDEPLYPLVLEFKVLQIASCLIVCWSAMLQTLAIVIRLHQRASRSSSYDLVWGFLDRKAFRNASPEIAIIVEAKRRAGLLCQSTEYTHREEMGSVGPQCMTYARGVLQRFFEENHMPRELAWCKNIPHMTNQRGERFVVQMLDFRA
ncbi:hypothetical protein NLU13_8035 [Sarocladium strictum]|uniref:Zn(2)-C6 fungal-type domain-containing protein n=1 Tax=Sarocladium strictum TaxID=5046 RepID=A0AA39L4T8_SARSR|nr:hypothetical protein NLU13_8035 [Sarocladium strictum]